MLYKLKIINKIYSNQIYISFFPLTIYYYLLYQTTKQIISLSFTFLSFYYLSFHFLSFNFLLQTKHRLSYWISWKKMLVFLFPPPIIPARPIEIYLNHNNFNNIIQHKYNSNNYYNNIIKHE